MQRTVQQKRYEASNTPAFDWSWGHRLETFSAKQIHTKIWHFAIFTVDILQ